MMDAALEAMARAFPLFAKPATVTRGEVSATVRAHARGLRGEELVAAAEQYDRLVIASVEDLEAGGLYPPARFDRITTGDGTFSVEDWRPSPAMGTPIFAKLLVKGGAR